MIKIRILKKEISYLHFNRLEIIKKKIKNYLFIYENGITKLPTQSKNLNSR
jgi:hypothetical protein